GGSGKDSGTVQCFGNLGVVNIAGSIAARNPLGNGSGEDSARIGCFGNSKSVSVAGSIIGGVDPDPSDGTQIRTSSGSIVIVGQAGTIKIGHDISGGTAKYSGSVFVGAAQKFSIGDSLIGAGGQYSGWINVATSIAQMKIGGDVRGGDSPGYDLQDTGAVEVG